MYLLRVQLESCFSGDFSVGFFSPVTALSYGEYNLMFKKNLTGKQSKVYKKGFKFFFIYKSFFQKIFSSLY